MFAPRGMPAGVVTVLVVVLVLAPLVVVRVLVVVTAPRREPAPGTALTASAQPLLPASHILAQSPCRRCALYISAAKDLDGFHSFTFIKSLVKTLRQPARKPINSQV